MGVGVKVPALRDSFTLTGTIVPVLIRTGVLHSDLAICVIEDGTYLDAGLKPPFHLHYTEGKLMRPLQQLSKPSVLKRRYLNL